MILGISGVAGAGKDTLFSILSSKINCKRYSLADELKQEVRSWCLEHYGIDPLECSREEKEIIRPLLVFHGVQKRNVTKGRYWIEKISNKILNDGEENKIITDIRFDDYEHDEVSWLKEELKGILVYVSQFSMQPDPKKGALIKKDKRPANAEEARNDPKLRERADFEINWPKVENAEDLETELSPYVNGLLVHIVQPVSLEEYASTGGVPLIPATPTPPLVRPDELVNKLFP